jgi:hypothetical protein
MAKTIVFEDDKNPSQEMKVFKNTKNSVSFEIYDADDIGRENFQNINLSQDDVRLLVKDLQGLLKNWF